jgi:hypothetical protein
MAVPTGVVRRLVSQPEQDRMSRFAPSLIAITVSSVLLAGCNGGSSPAPAAPAGGGDPAPDIVIAPAATPLSIPAYPSGFADISNSTWESCLYDSADNRYVRRQWTFVVNDAAVSQFRHAADDTTCTGTSTRDWYYDFEAISDEGGSAATGWVNAAGTATVGGGAPASLDGLGSLPAQPLARRSAFKLQGMFVGRPPYPYSTSPLDAPTKLLLFVDASATPQKLYVGSVSAGLDATGYPVYLESDTGLRRQ